MTFSSECMLEVQMNVDVEWTWACDGDEMSKSEESMIDREK